MTEKHKFKPIKKREPPYYVVEAWREYEAEIGEPITREEMAQVASIVLTRYFVDMFGIQGVRELAGEILNKGGKP